MDLATHTCAFTQATILHGKEYYFPSAATSLLAVEEADISDDVQQCAATRDQSQLSSFRVAFFLFHPLSISNHVAILSGAKD